MSLRKVVAVFFSPRNSTKTVVMRIAQGLGAKELETIDLLRDPNGVERRFGSDTLIVVGMPVYAGRIPVHCRALVQQLCSDGAVAVAAAVFGNRDYDDALLELCDLLRGQGFALAGAGAFSARHSIFPKVAADRPDAKDLEKIDEFARGCRVVLEEGRASTALSVKGNAEYREAGTVPLKPLGDNRCTACGACATICPKKAIDPAHPRETQAERCISCGACIECCPVGARGYHGVAYPVAAAGFALKCAARREPEVFYPE